MPRKLLLDSSGSWVGWESKTNQITRMSFNQMAETNKKNELEKHRHKMINNKLIKDRFEYDRKATKQIYDTKIEYVQMLAFKKVYVKNSFYSRTAHQKKSDEGTSDSGILPPKQDDNVPRVREGTRSLQRRVRVREETVPVTPALLPRNVRSSKGGRTVDFADIQPRRAKTSIGSIELPTVQLDSSTTDQPQEAESQRRISQIAQVQEAGETNATPQIVQSEEAPIPSPLPRVSIMDPKPADSKSRRAKEDAVKLRRRSDVHRECSSFFSMRNYMAEEAKKVIEYWSPAAVRKRRTEEIKDKIRAPDVISREKTTSAIMRDYRVAQKQRSLRRRHTVLHEPPPPSSNKPGAKRIITLRSAEEYDQYKRYLKSVVHNRYAPTNTFLPRQLMKRSVGTSTSDIKQPCSGESSKFRTCT